MKKMSAFVVGGVVGAVAALLAAPRPGDETRAIVTDWATNAMGGTGVDITERVQIRRDQITHDAGVIANQAGVIANDVAAKAKETANSVMSQVQAQAPSFGGKQAAENAANARKAVGGTMPSVQEAAKDVAERVQDAVDAVKGAAEDKAE